ncbi:MAG: hypothetical protein QF904_01335 [Gemmatimonadota bacterium]|nr:hypothetical protein [Gemmatimonadota bacterium]
MVFSWAVFSCGVISCGMSLRAGYCLMGLRDERGEKPGLWAEWYSPAGCRFVVAPCRSSG